jgi:alkylation response protein AidB-like acyl-CoA dehydrogenase
MGKLLEYPVAPELREFQQEVRDFIKQNLDEATRKERTSGEFGTGLGPLGRKFLRKMGDKGWMGLTWPKEYGGLGKGFMHRFILSEEMDYADAPSPGFGASVVGPCIMLFGTEWQKKEFLPKIAKGEIFFGLSYTEPEAGSDLASLKLAAKADGDDYVLNGQKIFNSETHVADYLWLAARTDFESPKHKGVSLFMVDAKAPGITPQAMYTLGGERTNIVFYDNVRVSKSHLLGEPNKGWYYLAAAIDLERFFPISKTLHRLENMITLAHQPGPSGRRPADDPVLLHRLSTLVVEAQAVRSLSFRMAWMQGKGVVPNIEASILKLFLREYNQRVARLGVQMFGLYGQLRGENGGLAPLHGELEKAYRASPVGTITGGTSEVQRNVIATRGLGLPR